MPRWVYSQMLALYPAEMRRQYGSEMLAHFVDDWREAHARGATAGLCFWFRIAIDWICGVASAHGEIARTDLAAAWGNLSRRPGTAGAFVLLLAAVLAMNAIALTLAERLLLRPLPLESSGSLVFLGEWREAGSFSWINVPLSFAETLRKSRSVADAAYTNAGFSDNTEGTVRHGSFVSPAMFRLLGMAPAAGRIFREDEKDVLILGPRLWEERYHLSPSVVGKTIHLAGRTFRIVGALSEQPDIPFDADAWISAASSPNSYGAVLARLRPGVSLETARREWSALRGSAPGYWPAELAPLRQLWRAPDFDYMAWGTVAAFSVVLLLACADLITFQLGQAVRRQKDIAIRLAMGASRARIVRFAMTETLAITLLSGLLSLPATALALRTFLSSFGDVLGEHRLAGWTSVRFDGTVVVLTMALAVLAGVLAGFVPAWKFASQDPWAMLNSGPFHSVRTADRLRSWLLGAQIGLAGLLLFVAATFSVEGNRRLHAPQVRYFDSTWSLGFTPVTSHPVNEVRNLMERLGAAGHRTIVTSAEPFGDEPFAIETEARGKKYMTQMTRVSASFFDIPGFRWISGRPWTEGEGTRQNRPPVAIGATLAREAGLKTGDSLVMLNANGRRVVGQVVGVVNPPPLDMYGRWPAQLVFIPWQQGPLRGNSLLVEGERSGIEAVVSAADPAMKLYVRNFANRIHGNSLIWFSVLAILWCSGLMALALALIGTATWMTQVFEEHGLELALRCATGSPAGGIWIWAARRVWRPLAFGSAGALAIGAVAFLIPSHLLPPDESASVAAAAIATVLGWGFWSSMLWIGSARAVGGSPAERLRHL